MRKLPVVLLLLFAIIVPATTAQTNPDKILFGTDAFSFGPEVDWPEVAWLSNTSARQALALALTGMMNDHEITRARALELAQMALRENAVKLYGLPK
jgi:predicted TIM-barrel fold metal-dependent hydrolase